MKRLLMAACIASLAACGADTEEYDVAKKYEKEWAELSASLVYSYPANDQEQVPAPSPVVLRFSTPVVETGANIVIRKVGGDPLVIESKDWVDDNQGVVINVEGGFDPLTRYQVELPAITLQKGETEAGVIRFKTAPFQEGPRKHVAEGDFAIVRTIPDGNNFPVVDFATFRVQFSAPLDPATVSYGDSVSLTGPSGLVDAHLFVDGPYLTVDPKDDLTPGENYTLTVSETVRSDVGDALGAGGALSLAMVPKDTGPRETLINDVAGNGMYSPLTGQYINMIPMRSVLLGKDTATQSEGVFPTEVAYAPNFPDVTPLRIPRGTLLQADEIAVLIGGAVDAGFSSGDVGITFISDATGYMVPNPYSDSDDAPRNIHIFMDVGIGTSDQKANGSINQNLLHIELVGTAIVVDGALTINAVGMAGPEILGSERAQSLLSFYMKAFDDQDNAPQPDLDFTQPSLVSWTPGDDVDDSFNTTDSILFVFDEPVSVDPSAVVLTETKTANGTQTVTELDATVSVDGTTLIIKPAQALKHSRETDDTNNVGVIAEKYSYEVSFNGDVTDLQGNGATGMAGSYSFELPTLGSIVTHSSYDPNTGAPLLDVYDIPKRAPAVLAVYPGFPCVFDETTMDLAQGVLGQCESGLKQDYVSPELWGFANGPSQILAGLDKTVRLADDIIYLPELPSNRPIVVQFSKNIDPDSVSDSTFTVSQIDPATGSTIGTISGSRTVEGKIITFWPDEPWEVGATYRYTIHSNGDSLDLSPELGGYVGDAYVPATPAVCDGTQAICDTDGLPVQTKLKGQRVVSEPDMNNDEMIVEDTVELTAGGPDMKQYFVGAPKTKDVLQALVAPSLDRNANLWAEINRPDKAGSSGVFYLDREGRSYAVEETSDEVPQPLPGSCTGPARPDCLDPDAVLPLANTTKLVSATAAELGPTFPLASGRTGGTQITAINTGCGYADPGSNPPVPETCPEDKFAYLNSGLIAEVGEYDANEDAVPVRIWPGQVMVSSLPVIVSIGDGYANMALETGAQRIRMRFAQDDPACVPGPGAPCRRSKLITAWLRDGASGPVLEATVDAYVDALNLEDFMDLRPMMQTPWRHEIFSAPITLELSGEVEFLEDGRMVVHQMNTNSISISSIAFMLDSGSSAPDPYLVNGILDFTIPEEGTYMKYISTPIK